MLGLALVIRVLGVVPVLPSVATIACVRMALAGMSPGGPMLRAACLIAGAAWPAAMYVQEFVLPDCDPTALSCGGELGGLMLKAAACFNGLVGLALGWLLSRPARRP